jgi:hypothetical protein
VPFRWLLTHPSRHRAPLSNKIINFRIWHIASFRCAAEFGRYRGMADSGKPSALGRKRWIQDRFVMCAWHGDVAFWIDLIISILLRPSQLVRESQPVFSGL